MSLMTKTGSRCSKESVTQKVLTKPRQVSNLAVSDLETTTASIHWSTPSEAKLLTSYLVTVTSETKSFYNEEVLVFAV